MDLERAAQALVDYKFQDADGYRCHKGEYWLTSGDMWIDGYAEVDPLNNEAQRQALLEWYKVEVSYYPMLDKWRGWNKTVQTKHVPKRIEAENACLTAILGSE